MGTKLTLDPRRILSLTLETRFSLHDESDKPNALQMADPMTRAEAALLGGVFGDFAELVDMEHAVDVVEEALQRRKLAPAWQEIDGRCLNVPEVVSIKVAPRLSPPPS